MGTKVMKASKVLCIAALLLISFSSCDSSKKKKEVSFNYQSILENEYRSSEGKVIPVTVDQAIETGGDISKSGEYFFYVSNENNGNFDIYMREMENIHIARITSHPSKETSPAISPDGKKLVFVSNREDPEGDIYILKINADKIISRARKKEITRGYDRRTKNLTLFQDPITERVMAIKDDRPAWSPDGDTIAFSSKRNGIENIWLMDDDGDNLRQLTSKGGLHPRYSEDGKALVFISYRDRGSRGEVYTIDLTSLKEKRITRDNNIKLYPSFHGTRNQISYTSIEKDTNKDGKRNLRDSSIIRFIDTSTGVSYPLTRSSRSSFNSKWLPNFRTTLYRGILLYSDQKGANININIIPEQGIIPMKAQAGEQLRHAGRYETEFNDSEKYLMALKAVYNFHENKKDLFTTIYTSRSLRILFREHLKRGNKKEAAEPVALLNTPALRKYPYAAAQLKYCKLVMAGRSGIPALESALEKASMNSADKSIVPFLKEDLGDAFSAEGNTGKALAMYTRIKREHPDVKKINAIDLKHSLLFTDYLNRGITDSALRVYRNGRPGQKIRLTRHLITVLGKDAPAERRKKLLKLLKTHKKNQTLQGVLNYSIASADKELGRYKKASSRANNILSQIKKTDILYFFVNSLLGDIAVKKNRYEKTEKFFYKAAANYLIIWKEEKVRRQIYWLIHYYEEYGERAALDNNFPKASRLYRKYADLMTALHRKGRFQDIYNQYGARAHVLYIDTVKDLGKRKDLTALNKTYRKKLARARMEFDKAGIYAIGYIKLLRTLKRYEGTKRRTADKDTSEENLLFRLKEVTDHMEWASFIDNSFIDPYILKSWIYQYVDILRRKKGGKISRMSETYFPPYLFERNLPLLKKALAANDEKQFPGHEAKIHLNLGNNLFNLSNFTEALENYIKAEKYGIVFKTKLEEAVYYFHRAHCFWQTGNTRSSRMELQRIHIIYHALSSGKNRNKYKRQIISIYRHFALLHRIENNYSEAMSWYMKILSESRKLKVKVDRPRCLQEIAWCHHNMGNDQKAIHFLKRANRILKRKNDTYKTYKIKWKIAGIIPFNFWDLEEDVVIGNTKFFRPLKNREKKLLNLSLFEEIYEKSNNYKKAVKYLKQKIQYFEQRGYDSDNRAIVTTLNNLGYYYFKLGKLPKSEKFFRKAWKKATEDSDNFDTDGAFAAVTNLANLYSYGIERGKKIHKDPLKSISRLLDNISSFRNKYEEITFKQQKRTLIKKAKTQNTEVSQQQLDVLQQEIALQANQMYFKIDIAMGVLLYYKTELLRRSWQRPEGPDTDEAFTLFTGQKDIFNGYRDSLSRFNKALSTINADSNPFLAVKLLLNQGACYIRMQAPERAYGSLLDAQELAEKYQLEKLIFLSSVKLGHFLHEFGRIVEGEDSILAAIDYLENARSLVRENPLLYTDRLDDISGLYNTYSALLLAEGEAARAFQLQREGSLITGNMLVHRASPEFSDQKDRKAYGEYIRLSLEIGRDSEDRSRRLLSGLSKDDKSIIKIDEIINSKNELLYKMRIKIEKENRKIFRFLSSIPKDIQLPPETTVISFFESEKGISAFYKDENILKHRLLLKNSTPQDTRDINNFFKELPQNSRVYITLNRSFSHVMQVKGIKLPHFMAVSDLRDIADSDGKGRMDFSTLYHTGRGLRSYLEETPVKVEEGKNRLFPLESYSIIVNTTEDTRFSPRELFSRPTGSTLLIQKLEELDFRSMQLSLKAARYAGIQTIIFTTIDEPEMIAEIVKTSGTSTFNKSSAVTAGEYRTIPMGYPGMTAEERNSYSSLKTDTWYASYIASVKSQDYHNAGIKLESWKNSLEKASKEELIRYYLDSSMLLLLRNKADMALKILDEILDSDTFPEETQQKTLRLFSAYLHAESGNIDELEKFLQDTDQNSKEIKILRYIAEAARGTSSPQTPAFLIENNKKEEPVFLGRLRFLASRYLYLAGSEKSAKEILQNRTADLVLNPSEDLLLAFLQLKKSTARSIFSQEEINGKALNIFNEKDAAGIIKKLSAPDTRVFPENLHWTIEALYSMEAARFLIKYNRHEKASEYITRAQNSIPTEDITSCRTMLHHLESIRALSLAKYPEAFAGAEEAEKGMSITHPYYIENQMVLLGCEARLKKTKDAEERLHMLLGKKKKTRKVRFHLHLLAALIELKKSADRESSDPSEKNTFQKPYFKALSAFDKSPSVEYPARVINLYTAVADAHIGYKIAKGKTKQALISSEQKKHMRLRLKIRAGQKRLQAAKKNGGEISSSHFRASLKKNPSILMSKNISFVKLKGVRNKLTPKDLLLYFVRNGENIHSWVFTKKNKKFISYSGAYPRMKELISSYKSSASKLQNTYKISRTLKNEFAALEQYLNKTSRIYIITDEYLEEIPFEIMGENRLLEETHRIAYVSSLHAALMDPPSSFSSYSLVAGTGEHLYETLEKTAIEESGTAFSRTRKEGAFLHYFSSIYLDPFTGMLYNRKNPFFYGGEKTPGLYVSQNTEARINGSELTLYGTTRGISWIIINNCEIHDINNAVFLSRFYYLLKKGNPPIKAFSEAKRTIIQKKEFRHPSYWQGLRIYCNGI